ncbi:MAG: 30S ribosomal protein S17 [Acidobacteria bacterium]|nr:MAG: 30S ribosomal protein S17 [Acidobacteriota bacterium]RLE29462.1 MAG: 30S ribosomal protein S17 [Acidobacteriota bacterium]
MADVRKTGRKTTKVGIVLTNEANKSVVVKVESLVMHPLYRKFSRTSTKFMAHDEENTCNRGDRVLIEECRPLSKRKRWRVRHVIERAQ